MELTKPVMWTDEEASARLLTYLLHKDWEVNQSKEDESVFAVKKQFIDHLDKFYLITENNGHQYEHLLLTAIERVSGRESITPDSLLHDLNIIKPIGRLEYRSEWIDKILSGQKTMSIRKTQHACGHYELWDTDRQEVRGIVEVTLVEKFIFLFNRFNDPIINITIFSSMTLDEFGLWWDDVVRNTGFDTRKDFKDYHRANFQSVKYAITYRVVDMKGDVE